MSKKSRSVRIRVSPEEESLLKLVATQQGVSLSAYILRQCIPSAPPPLQPSFQAETGGRVEAAEVDVMTALGLREVVVEHVCVTNA